MKIPETIRVKRITLRGISEEIFAQVNLEKGLGYTIWQLIVAPGSAIRAYLFEDRSRMMRPLSLVLLVTAIATFISMRYLLNEAHLEAELQKSNLPAPLIPVMALFLKLSRQYFNLMLLSGLPAISFGTYLIFRDRGLNYAEHLVINTYIFATQTILYLPLLPFLNKIPEIGFFIYIISIGYTFYAIMRVFQIRFMEALWRLIVAYFIAQVIQMIFLGILILIFWLIL
ncbi:MAG: DUF3667 domain-containing protein [Saprospiraceae bacterium]|nr:DUF3667 domain-containing protein [Saprospiraceae bacterium]